jgi:hypothetical protein
VIVGNSTPVLAALRQATTTIPIVFVVVNDPVGQGFVSSLALEQTASPSARRYPACRLVLTPGAAVELMNQLQKLMTVMIQAGVLKPTAQPPGVKSANEVIK